MHVRLELGPRKPQEKHDKSDIDKEVVYYETEVEKMKTRLKTIQLDVTRARTPKDDLDRYIELCDTVGKLSQKQRKKAQREINNLQEAKDLKPTEVLSPTFNLLYEYDIKDLKIMHYDLYRIKESKELNHLGIFSEDQDTIKIIEWPDLIKTPLKDKLEIYLNYAASDDEREMKIVGFGKWKNFENEL